MTFTGGEPASTVLTGFTIRNGLDARGGGILGNATRATISNSRITSNTALISGGGLHGFHGRIHNTIIDANSAPRGGGLTVCTGTITNCIIWGNVAPSRASIDVSSTPMYSCIEGWTGGGLGNLASDPRLADPANGDFRLAADSPCIDAGGAAPGLDSDFEGDWRPSDGTRAARGDGSDYDIGADEYAALTFVTNADPVLVPEGATATLRLKLSTRPPARLRALVSRSSGDSNMTVTGAVEFLFTPEEWSAWQSVTLAAAEDADTSNGQATIRIRLRYGPAGAIPDAFVTAIEQDDDDPKPDLTGRLSDIMPRHVTQGATVTLAGSIFNEGTKATTAPIRVEFQAISGWGGVQTFLPPITLRNPLAAGASFNLASTGPLVVSSALAWSSYTIQMRIDSANAIAESDELDNTAAFAPFWVMPPKANLQVRNFDFAPQDVATSGGAITFAGQILNGGAQPTTGSYKIEFRVSSVPYFRITGAELCEPHTETRSLAPGESLDLATLGLMPIHRLPRGVYSVCISVDRANAVAEQTKADNTAWRLGRKFLYIGGRPTGASGWMLYR